MTTKILALPTLKNLAEFSLRPGQSHDLHGVSELIEGLRVNHMLADRAFDTNWLRQSLSERGISPVIPPHKNRKHSAEYCKEMYKWRHLVEDFFQKIKYYRGIETATAKRTQVSQLSRRLGCKYRYKLLQSSMRERIRDIIRQTCDEMGVCIMRGALAWDHVHMFLLVSPKLAL